MLENLNKKNGITIIYDNDCPVCTAYVKYSNLKETFENVDLINIRENNNLYSEYLDRGVDLNNGMIVQIGETEYYGSDAFFIINRLIPENYYLSKVLNFFIPNEKAASFFYPILVKLRKLFLFIRGAPLK